MCPFLSGFWSLLAAAQVDPSDDVHVRVSDSPTVSVVALGVIVALIEGAPERAFS